MKLSFLPKTRKGIWSVSLFAAFIVLAAAARLISFLTGNTLEYPDPINSPLLGTTIYLTFAAAILASLVGLISVVRNKEHAISVFVAIPLGIVFFIVIVVFLIANLIGPPG